MAIIIYESEEEMDDVFEDMMERMQEEEFLRDAICRAEEEVAAARDALEDAEEELRDLEEQFKALNL